MKKNILKLFFILFICFGAEKPSPVYSQIRNYSFEQADSLSETEKRNFVVFIHTDWCRYCQVMKNTTFKNDSIISILDRHFYFISLNAESPDDIFFHGHKFRLNQSGVRTGLHELAEHLGSIDDKVSYPTLCFLNADYEIILQVNSYMDASGLYKILDTLK